jgi:Flp pilus assembly protein TadD
MRSETFRSHIWRFALRWALHATMLFLVASSDAGARQTTKSDDFANAAKAAENARESGRRPEAIELYKKSVALRPDWAEGWWYLGTLQYDADQFRAAIPAFQQLTKLMPELAAARNFLGLCEYETGAYDVAKTDLEHGQTAEQPDDEESGRAAAYHLALLLNRAGDFDKSAALIAKVFAAGSFPTEAQFALGIATLHVALLPQEIEPSKDAIVSKIGEAATLQLQGRAAAAARVYAEAAERNAHLPYIHFAHGSALAASGDNEGALKQFREELNIFPANGDARTAIDNLEAKRGGTIGTRDNSNKRPKIISATTRDADIAKLYSRSAPDSTTHPAANQPGSTDFEEEFERLKRVATTLQSAGKFDEAIASLEKATALRPNWDEGVWNLAMLSYARGRPAEALRALSIWTARNPNSGTAWAVMGLCEFALRDFENSLLHFARADSLGFTGSPESVRTARYHYAMLLVHAGKFSKASQILSERALNTASDNELQFIGGLASLHLQQFPAEVSAAQKPLVERTGKAIAFLNVSKYDDGLSELKRLVSDYPKAPRLHFLYGKGLSALSNYDEAAMQFEQETKLSPLDSESFVDLALTQLQQHHTEEALAPAERATQLAPESAEAHYALGRVNLDLRRNDAAASELALAARLAPSSPEIHFNLAKAYARQNQPEKAEAERAIFARLSELAELQRAGNRNQTYGEKRGEGTLSSAPADPRQ